jgi:hypothetical protein
VRRGRRGGSEKRGEYKEDRGDEPGSREWRVQEGAG